MPEERNFMDDCLFCRIIQRKQPASVVYESPLTLAIRDAFPKAPIHVLVIPKEHIESLLHWEPRHSALGGEILETVRAVAVAEKADAGGFRVVVNNGKDSHQTVPHLHFHVLAGRQLGWPPG